MSHQVALDFIRQNHWAILATRRRDRGVQLSPVLATVDAEERVVISSRETAVKVRNLRRDPLATLCALNHRFFGDWYTIEGSAETIHLPDAMEPLVDYYRRVVGEHPDWEDYREAMVREQRVLVRITVERSGPKEQG